MMLVTLCLIAVLCASTTFALCGDYASQNSCLANINEACEYDAVCIDRSSCSPLTTAKKCMIAAVCDGSNLTTTKCFWNPSDMTCGCDGPNGMILDGDEPTLTSPMTVGDSTSTAFSFQTMGKTVGDQTLPNEMYENGGSTFLGTTFSSGFCAGNPAFSVDNNNIELATFSIPASSLPSSSISFKYHIILGERFSTIDYMLGFFQYNTFYSSTNYSLNRVLDCNQLGSDSNFADLGQDTATNFDKLDPNKDLLVVIAGFEVPSKRKKKKRNTGFQWAFHIVFEPVQNTLCSKYGIEDACRVAINAPCYWDGSDCKIRSSCADLTADSSHCMSSKVSCDASNNNNNNNNNAKCGWSLATSSCDCDATVWVNQSYLGSFISPQPVDITSPTVSFAWEGFSPTQQLDNILLPIKIYNHTAGVYGNDINSTSFSDQICPQDTAMNGASGVTVLSLPIDRSSVSVDLSMFWYTSGYPLSVAFFQMKDSLLSGNFTVTHFGPCLYSNGATASSQAFNNVTLDGLDPTKPLLVAVIESFSGTLNWGPFIAIDYQPKPSTVTTEDPSNDNTDTSQSSSVTSTQRFTSTNENLFNGVTPFHHNVAMGMICFFALLCSLL